MRCFYCSTLLNGRIELSEQEERHIFSVNRLRPEEKLLLIDGEGLVVKAELLKNKTFKILNITREPEPEIKLHLFVAPPRKQQMDQIIEQSSEVGIWSITPIMTERGVSTPDKSNDNPRWKVKIIESCKQSHNPYFPKINQMLSFDEALKKVKELKFTSFFGSTEDSPNIELGTFMPKLEGFSFLEKNTGELDFNPPTRCHEQNIAWFVGPEGGFSTNEIELMKTNNVASLKLGTAIMRVETAAIVGAAYLLNSLNLK